MASSHRLLGGVVTVVIVGAAITLALVLRGGGAAAPPPTLPSDAGVVEWVIDGDTVDITIGGVEERVRLIGIDTPEAHTETGVAECFGNEAWAFTREQLAVGTQVRLERDVVGRDDYGRLLAYVFRVDDGVMVNELIIAGGFARPLTIRPNDFYGDRFVAAATAAERGDLGLWAACRG